jgi:hypothetical protein
MYVYVTGTGSGTGSGIPVPVVFFDRNRTSPTFFYEKKKESNRNSCGSPVHCEDTKCTCPVIKKTTGASSALLGAYLKIGA